MERPTSAQVTISRVCEFEPCIRLCADTAPSLPLILCPHPPCTSPACALSLSLSKTEHYKNNQSSRRGEILGYTNGWNKQISTCYVLIVICCLFNKVLFLAFAPIKRESSVLGQLPSKHSSASSWQKGREREQGSYGKFVAWIWS